MAAPTILIVDYEPTNLFLLTSLLKSDYVVRAVNSGESALRAAASKPRPDLVEAKLASDAIEQAKRDIEVPLKFLAVAREIARWHNDKWDGSRCPDGLSGDGDAGASASAARARP